MITEQDLRAALTRRAEAAPAFDPDRALAIMPLNHGDEAPSPRRHSRLAIAGAALSVGVAVAAAAVLTDRPSSPVDAGNGAPIARTSQPVPSTTPADNPSTSSPTDGPNPATTPAGLQLPRIVWVISQDRISSVDRRPNVDFVTVQVGSTHTSIAGYRAGVFTASRVAHAVPIRVDGHRGLFGEVSVWPVNGRPDPRSGKQDAAAPSLAWRLGRGGPWVVLQIDASLTPTRSELLAAARHVTVRPAA